MLNIKRTSTNPIVFFGDSILSGFNASDSPQTNVWIHMLSRDPAYGYQGDIFAEAYAGRILQHDTANLTTGLIDQAKVDALAAKLASYQKVGDPVVNYWFQIGVNDYGFSNVTLSPPFSVMSLANFTEQYAALVDKLHELRPSSKIYIQCAGPDFYEGPNKESVDPLDPDIPTGPTLADFRNAQKDIAFGVVASGPNAGVLRNTFCEYVDFFGEAGSAFAGVFGETGVANPSNGTGVMSRSDIFNIYGKDGIHPNDLGQVKYADAVRDRSSLLNGVVNLPLVVQSIRTSDNVIFSTIPPITQDAYSAQLSAANGIAPYTFTISGVGNFPTGITMNSSGLITGTTSAALGTSYTVSVLVTDSTPTVPKTVIKTYTGTVTNTISGIPENIASISTSSMVHSDVYDVEWTTPLEPARDISGTTVIAGQPSPFLSTVARSGLLLAPTTSAVNAGLHSFFIGGEGSGSGDDGLITFEAKGTGTLSIMLFETFNMNLKSYRGKKTFLLDPDNFTVYTMDINLWKGQEGVVSIIFNDGLGNIATNVEIKKNFSMTLNTGNFGLTGLYKRWRADQNTLLGNVDTGWGLNNTGWGGYSNNHTNNVFNGRNNCYKYFQASAFAMQKFETDAPYYLVEYVRDMYDGNDCVTAGIGIFEKATTGGGSYEEHISQANGPDAGTKLWVKKVTSGITPGQLKIVDVVSGGQSQVIDPSGNSVHPDINRAGTYLRAVYVPEGYTFNPILTPPPDSMLVVGDSIISGYCVSSFPHKNLFIHRIHRYATFGYPGDIYACANGSRMLMDNIATPTLRADFVARCAALNVNKYWMQIGINDWYNAISGPLVGNRPAYTQSQFVAAYGAFCDELHAAKPSAKIFIQTITPSTNEGVAANTWRAAQASVATGRSWCEVVDFTPAASGSSASGIWTVPETNTYIHDGPHPNDAGNLRLAQAMGQRSATLYVPSTLSFSPSSLGLSAVTRQAYSQQFTAINGSGSYSFSATGLPGWLSINSSGLLSGTAPTTGSVSTPFSITVTDTISSLTHTISGFVMTVTLPTIVISAGLPGGVAGNSYTTTLSASGSVAPYTYALQASTLPNTLTLSSAGIISGTLQAGVTGTFSFTVRATDVYGNFNDISKSITITNTPVVITVNPSTLPAATSGSAYGPQTVTATGGTAPYVYALTGSYPAGMTINPSTGDISGTITAVSGSYTFGVSATDAGSNVGTRTYTGFTVNPAAKDLTISIGRRTSDNHLILTATLNNPNAGPILYIAVNAYGFLSTSGASGVGSTASCGSNVGTTWNGTSTNMQIAVGATSTTQDIGAPANLGVTVFNLNIAAISGPIVTYDTFTCDVVPSVI